MARDPNVAILQDIIIRNLDTLGINMQSTQIGNYTTGAPDGILGSGTALALDTLVTMGQIAEPSVVDGEDYTNIYNDTTIGYIANYMSLRGVSQEDIALFSETANASLNGTTLGEQYQNTAINTDRVADSLNAAQFTRQTVIDARAAGGDPIQAVQDALAAQQGGEASAVDPANAGQAVAVETTGSEESFLIQPNADYTQADGTVYSNGRVAVLQEVIINNLDKLDLGLTAAQIGGSDGQPDDLLGGNTATALQTIVYSAQIYSGVTADSATLDITNETHRMISAYLLNRGVSEEDTETFMRQIPDLNGDLNGAYSQGATVDVNAIEAAYIQQRIDDSHAMAEDASLSTGASEPVVGATAVGIAGAAVSLVDDVAVDAGSGEQPTISEELDILERELAILQESRAAEAGSLDEARELAAEIEAYLAQVEADGAALEADLAAQGERLASFAEELDGASDPEGQPQATGGYDYQAGISNEFDTALARTAPTEAPNPYIPESGIVTPTATLTNAEFLALQDEDVLSLEQQYMVDSYPGARQQVLESEGIDAAQSRLDEARRFIAEDLDEVILQAATRQAEVDRLITEERQRFAEVPIVFDYEYGGETITTRMSMSEIDDKDGGHILFWDGDSAQEQAAYDAGRAAFEEQLLERVPEGADATVGALQVESRTLDERILFGIREDAFNEVRESAQAVAAITERVDNAEIHVATGEPVSVDEIQDLDAVRPVGFAEGISDVETQPVEPFAPEVLAANQQATDVQVAPYGIGHPM